MMDTIEVYVCVLYSQNLQIQTPKKIQTGARAGAGSAFGESVYIYFHQLFLNLERKERVKVFSYLFVRISV